RAQSCRGGDRRPRHRLRPSPAREGALRARPEHAGATRAPLDSFAAPRSSARRRASQRTRPGPNARQSGWRNAPATLLGPQLGATPAGHARAPTRGALLAALYRRRRLERYGSAAPGQRTHATIQRGARPPDRNRASLELARRSAGTQGPVARSAGRQGTRARHRAALAARHSGGLRLSKSSPVALQPRPDPLSLGLRPAPGPTRTDRARTAGKPGPSWRSALEATLAVVRRPGAKGPGAFTLVSLLAYPQNCHKWLPPHFGDAGCQMSSVDRRAICRAQSSAPANRRICEHSVKREYTGRKLDRTQGRQRLGRRPSGATFAVRGPYALPR